MATEAEIGREVTVLKLEYEKLQNGNEGPRPKKVWAFKGDNVCYGTAWLEKPFGGANAIEGCCGILELLGWQEPEGPEDEWDIGWKKPSLKDLDEDHPADRRAQIVFRLWQLRCLPTMGYGICITSTNQYQKESAKLLRKYGFKATHAYNQNSGNNITLWSYVIHPVKKGK